VANRLVGSTLAECGRAMLPAVWVSLGTAALAGPVLVVMEPGVASLAAVIAAGAAGGALGALLGARSTVTDLVRTVRARVG
jgi:PST family polysaccharide transporter